MDGWMFNRTRHRHFIHLVIMLRICAVVDVRGCKYPPKEVIKKEGEYFKYAKAALFTEMQSAAHVGNTFV